MGLNSDIMGCVAPKWTTVKEAFYCLFLKLCFAREFKINKKIYTKKAEKRCNQQESKKNHTNLKSKSTISNITCHGHNRCLDSAS